MSEKYEKEGQNYNFWNEQAKMSRNDNEAYREQPIEQEQQPIQNIDRNDVSAENVKEQINEPVRNAAHVNMNEPIEDFGNANIDEPVRDFNSVNINQPIEDFSNANMNEPVRDFSNTNMNEAIGDFSNANINEPVREFGDANRNKPAENNNVENMNFPTEEIIYQKEDSYANAFQNVQAESEPFSENAKAKKKKNGTGKKFLGLAASAAIFGVVASLTFGGVQYVGNKLFPKQTTETEKTTINQNTGNKISTTTISDKGNISGQTDVTAVVEKTMPSIVSITSQITMNNGYFGTQNQEGSGSGIIINKSDKELLVVTNNHVIEGADSISVQFIDGSTVKATVKGTSSTADLAVLTISLKNVKEETLNKISVIEMGNSKDIKVGQMSIAIGNALGYGQSVTVGYISAKDREVQTEKSNTMKLLQTDAAINPGNSGGALLDKDGKLIGINSAKYSDTAVEGMGYAIPISEATPIINDLMKREVLTEEEKGYLGVMIGESSAAYNMPEGAYVSEVNANSAAEEAGILVGDIITKVDDIEIKTPQALQEKVTSLRAGTKVKVTLMRYANGVYEEKTLDVTLKTLEDSNNQSENANENTQPNQGQNNNNGNNNGNNNENNNGNNYNNGQGGRQIDPNDEESLEEFLEYYFGE